jgi:hypothetical protein
LGEADVIHRDVVDVMVKDVVDDIISIHFEAIDLDRLKPSDDLGEAASVVVEVVPRAISLGNS